jgi:hypothetical protein
MAEESARAKEMAMAMAMAMEMEMEMESVQRGRRPSGKKVLLQGRSVSRPSY